jgi:hypothetical protein
MTRLIPALLSALFLFPAVAFADDPPPPGAQGCGIVSGALISQDKGQVMINCVGVTEEFGTQLAGILTYVLQHRLDPELVVAKLDEIQGMPAGDAPRTLDASQGQTILQALLGKPSAEVAIVANPEGKDTADYALAIASKLQLGGWQIAGGQIRRTVPPAVADIAGLVLVVHDANSPPDAALRLKQAMASAKLFVPIVSDASLAPDATMLWVGKRPEFNAAQQ